MKITGFIERENAGLIRMLLIAAGLSREPSPQAPPSESVAVTVVSEPVPDYPECGIILPAGGITQSGQFEVEVNFLLLVYA